MIKIFEDEYIIGVKRIEKSCISEVYGEYQTTKRMLGYWVADPFAIELDGILYIFAELWSYREAKGSIAYCVFDGKNFSKWKVVIKEWFHMSYPNIFMYHDRIYMCPETYQKKEIILYKAINFPDNWEKCHVLSEKLECCDTTFLKDEEEIFGFTYVLGKEPKIKTFQIKDKKIEFLKGEILEKDDCCIRPGGKMFYDEEQKQEFRVAQVGLPEYGSGIALKKIIKFDNDTYKEENVCTILPSEIRTLETRKYTGLHTLNTTEHYCIIDLKWNRINIVELFWKTVRKIKKIWR